MISWEEFGIAFDIPPGAVPEDREPLELTVRPCLAGPFNPPDGYKLTSPTYVISPAFNLSRIFNWSYITLLLCKVVRTVSTCPFCQHLPSPTMQEISPSIISCNSEGEFFKDVGHLVLSMSVTSVQ